MMNLNSPRFVHIRIGQITFPGGNESKGPKKVTVQLLPIADGATTDVSGTEILVTTTSWSFRFADPRDSFICVTISDVEQNYLLKECSRVTIPLTWFSVNCMVRFAFPMLTKTPQKGIPMVYLDVHISDTGAIPFAAPMGPLLVTPSWDVPEGLSDYVRPPQNQSPQPPSYPQAYARHHQQNQQQEPQQQTPPPQKNDDHLEDEDNLIDLNPE
ncbi:GABA-A receptor epsilon [Histomonas meleagridis]|uniref:GABA-A receptor epsilon n=1 Tax=Histomonas meleagridis TaxID=135588 RepID=UPI003559AEBE|nr:GABA-A receptor epsilon [Histomonas meleagridis]KAH0798474.1 GABA-A receptor epsilon [Histomonas meleagridis]